MIRFLLRLLWRSIIFLLGVIALIIIVQTLWPNDQNQLAIFATLLFTYSLMAYIIVPNLMRLFHVFSKPDRIPLYVTTVDGWPSDPINLAIVARSQKQLERAMNNAGWYTADALTFRNGFRELISILFNRPYPEAPLSLLYLFDRPHDIGFEIPTNSANSARTRHHVRFWRLTRPRTESEHHKSHYHFWRHKLKQIVGIEKTIWIGAATEETRAVDIQWRTGRFTHGGSHESDKERDFIISTLKKSGHIANVSMSESGDEIKFRGQQFRTHYITDGRIKIVTLKPQLLPRKVSEDA